MKKLLIANRGEIAIRIMRTAHEMGIKTVAVYSEADVSALHVRYANEAVCIGPPPSSESYLVIEKLIAAAKETGADAIHPGYGFLSERSAFANAVEAAGLIFVGPTGKSMDTMGSKLAAKAAVKSYNIPLVPGSAGAITDPKEAIQVATEIGFPVLIKASAGGGGKGMRLVTSADELEEQMARAQSEARSSFGDDSVFVEKFVGSPRHIEIQVIADTHGNVVHLFERECSVQRRHQKVVEEAPSAVLTETVRQKMGEAAINVAKACDYRGAGTVEFLMDENQNFYFLEMNTRLQVEHPVTEMITDVDLVKEQIRIARGEKLSFTQEDLKIRGHAIEVRVYAEDPANNFLPNSGTILSYRIPKGPGVRVDDAFESGMEVPIYYDPMIAKLITYGATREMAMDRMIRAIDEYEIVGIQTTLGFGSYVMKSEAFRSGNFDTNFIKNHFNPDDLKETGDGENLEAAAVAMQHFASKKSSSAVTQNTKNRSNWRRNRND